MSAPAPPEPLPASGLAAVIAAIKVASTSVFFTVIVVTYIGFGALAHDYGFPVGWATLSTALMWAGPAQVIVVTALGSGAAIFEVALAVGLSAAAGTRL